MYMTETIAGNYDKTVDCFLLADVGATSGENAAFRVSLEQIPAIYRARGYNRLRMFFNAHNALVNGYGWTLEIGLLMPNVENETQDQVWIRTAKELESWLEVRGDLTAITAACAFITMALGIDMVTPNEANMNAYNQYLRASK